MGKYEEPVMNLLEAAMESFPEGAPQIAYLENSVRGVYVHPDRPRGMALHAEELETAWAFADSHDATLAVVMRTENEPYSGEIEKVRLFKLFKPRGAEDA